MGDEAQQLIDRFIRLTPERPVPKEAVRAAIAYCERHRMLIDNRLDRNASAVDLAVTS